MADKQNKVAIKTYKGKYFIVKLLIRGYKVNKLMQG